MDKAILGKKIGMSQIFTDSGLVIPVTVVEAGPCVVVQKKTKEVDGYEAVVVGYGDIRENLKNKPELGLFKKANVAPKRYLKELKLDNMSELNVGDEIKVGMFVEGDVVDVTGTSKGHGFSGVIKRWNAARLKMTHGTGPVHREVGSLSANSTPSRVFKNRKMPGQYGNEQVTIQNLKVVKVDEARNCILIKGAIPGSDNGLVVIGSAKKAKK